MGLLICHSSFMQPKLGWHIFPSRCNSPYAAALLSILKFVLLFVASAQVGGPILCLSLFVITNQRLPLVGTAASNKAFSWPREDEGPKGHLTGKDAVILIVFLML